ncbi:MAG TPA: hypothetical protein VEP90_28635 [Methylomirabilota bacterium]|nr:hypothetical protein [Methylomirabilota bacterium]
MRKVIIESPFMRNKTRTQEQHEHYARLAVRDAVLRGEAPIASHLLLTQKGILNDDVPEERTLGIEAGLAWMDCAEASIFYTDCGWSSGMIAALKRCQAKEGYLIEFRSIFESSCYPPWTLNYINSK